MKEKNTAGKGRRSTTSPGKPESNRVSKKKNAESASPAKKRWSKEKSGSTDGRKKKDPPFAKDYQKARSGSGNGARPGAVDDRLGSDGGQRQTSGTGVPTASSNNKPGPGSFKTYRNNRKNSKSDPRNKGGAAPGRNAMGAKGKDVRRETGERPAKGKGNPKRDAFFKSQSGPAKATISKPAVEEKNFDNEHTRKTSPSRQHKKVGAKPASGKHKTGKAAKPGAGKTFSRPVAKRASSKKRK